MLQAEANLRAAWLAAARTQVLAPVSGYVVRRAVQLGQQVDPSTEMLAIVPVDSVWVDANFKENQLGGLRIGQPVSVSADMYGSHVHYHGKVLGLTAGTGSALAVLPAQNASGNWIKIVQRLPVRIGLDARGARAASAVPRPVHQRRGRRERYARRGALAAARLARGDHHRCLCRPGGRRAEHHQLHRRCEPRPRPRRRRRQRLVRQGARPLMNAAVARAAAIPWLIAPVVALAAFMEIMDISIANVSLPHIAGALSSSQNESTWVLTSYLVTNAIVMPISGWLSNTFGRKRLFLTCIAGFTIASLLCGLAPNLPTLIVLRALQGATGGGLQPVGQAILADSFPAEKRGMATAIYGIAAVVAPTIGPTLGGWITDSYNWRWIFLINVPVGVAADRAWCRR